MNPCVSPRYRIPAPIGKSDGRNTNWGVSMYRSSRSRSSFGLVSLLVAMAALLAPVGAQAAAAATADDAVAVESYQDDFGVSARTAEGNLEIQERGASIVGQLQGALGADYAGVWFDNDAAEFVVPVLDAGDGALAEAKLRELNLGSDSRIVAADETWDELLVAHEKLDKSMPGQLAAGHVQTSLDPRANAVLLEQARGLDRGTKRLIESKASAA